jgi:MFS family permease
VYKKIGLRNEIIISSAICAIGYALSALWYNPYYVLFCIGMILGFGCGLLNVCSMWPSWAHFDNTNSTIAGIVLMGYSISPGVFGFIFTNIVNPDNLPPDKSDSSSDKVFPDSVSERVPLGLWVFSGIIVVSTIIALILIYDSPNGSSEEEEKEEVPEAMPYKEIFKSLNFWRLFFQFYMNFFLVIFLFCNFRSILLLHISDDHLIAYAGTLSTVSIIVGRMFSMYILERSNYIVVMTLINISTIMLCITMPMIWANPVLSISWVCAMYFISGGIYASGMIETYINFPGEDGKKIFPLLNIPWTLCTFSIAGITSIGDEYGYDIAFYTIALITMLSQIMLCVWKARPRVMKEQLLVLNEEIEEVIKDKV